MTSANTKVPDWLRRVGLVTKQPHHKDPGTNLPAGAKYLGRPGVALTRATCGHPQSIRTEDSNAEDPDKLRATTGRALAHAPVPSHQA